MNIVHRLGIIAIISDRVLSPQRWRAIVTLTPLEQ